MPLPTQAPAKPPGSPHVPPPHAQDPSGSRVAFERARSRAVGGAFGRMRTLPFLLLSTTLLACSGRPAREVTFGSGLSTVAAPPEIAEQEKAMFQRLNRDRAAQGLPPLAYDERLADIARYHSADMRDHSFFAHESPTSGSLADRLTAAGYLALAARENLSEAPDVEVGQDGLLRSPGHHANIMATDITHVGIGIVRGGVHDPRNLTITQVFARPGQAESADEARQSIAVTLRQVRTERGLPPAPDSDLLRELAQRYVDSLARGEVNLDQVADRVTQEVSQHRSPKLRGVLVSAQRITQASEFQPPGELLSERNVSLGLAVAKAQEPNGRPVFQVLLLMGL